MAADEISVCVDFWTYSRSDVLVVVCIDGQIDNLLGVYVGLVGEPDGLVGRLVLFFPALNLNKPP